MRLNKEEKECLRLLTKWSQAGRVTAERAELIEELSIEDGVYKSFMKKMEEIQAAYDVAQGMGQDYAVYFKISASALLQDIWQWIESENKD